ncbi:MAG: tetraacyldisaccharide 4'-kinase, partial [Acinetobacter sp.]
FNREIWIVPVEAVLSEQCYQLLHKQLTQLGIDLIQGS